MPHCVVLDLISTFCSSSSHSDFIFSGADISKCELQVNLADLMLAIEQTTPSLSEEELERYKQVRLHFSGRGKNRPSSEPTGQVSELSQDMETDDISGTLLKPSENNQTQPVTSDSTVASKRKSRKKKK